MHHPLLDGGRIGLVQTTVECNAANARLVIDRDQVWIDIGGKQGVVIEGQSVVGIPW